ncbi:MAG: 2-C-methyl-D-erythritol 4-phosphate cytidylyltransferase, partial [Pseudomonadota bacterium]
MLDPKLTAALIVAAGRGVRAGGAVPKQYQELAGRPVIARTVETFANHPGIGHICVVISEEDRDLAVRALGPATP